MPVFNPMLPAELEKMSLRELKKVAEENGVDKKAVENCDAHDNPKETVLQLILAKKATPVVSPMLPAELEKMSLRELKKVAEGNGVDKEAVANCDAHDYPKEAVLQLILAKRATPAFNPMLPAELEKMSLRELKKIAKENGVDKEAVENCDAHDNPKEAVLQLVKAALAVNPMLLAELENMSLRELKKVAEENGVDKEAVTNCDAHDNPKEAVLQLILAKRATPALNLAELEKMSLKDLKKIAQGNGVDKEAVTNCDAHDNPKEAVLQLIFAKKATPAANLAELEKMTLRDLKKVAEENGVDGNLVTNCDAHGNPKEAVLQLILAKRATLANNPMLPAGSERMSLKDLKKIAQDNGVDKKAVENCAARDNPKKTALQLVLANKATPVVNTMLPVELEKMSLRELKKVAEGNGVDKEAVTNCDAHDNPKEAVLQLISAKRDWLAPTAFGASEDLGLKTILIIGATGDGKSTLVNNLIIDDEQEALVSMNVKGTTKSVREYRGRNNTIILDTPGVGDYDISVIKLYTLLEEALSQKDRGIHYIVVTTPLNNGRFHLALQMVQVLVRRGFFDNNGQKWDHIIVCGTKKDRADPHELESFKSIVDLFFEDAPTKTGASATVDMGDISELENVIITKPTKKIVFQAIGEEELANEFSAKFGFNSIGEFVSELRKEREATVRGHQEVQTAIDGGGYPWVVFCSHTKQSSKWSCEDFVRDHIWRFFENLGVRTFYDRVALVGSPIEECLKAAAHTKVMLVVLDDASPSRWMQAEIEVALGNHIPVQAIYCKDKFSWEEVGKPAWEQRNIPTDLVHGVFERSPIQFDCNPLNIDTAKVRLMEVMYLLLCHDNTLH